MSCVKSRKCLFEDKGALGAKSSRFVPHSQSLSRNTRKETGLAYAKTYFLELNRRTMKYVVSVGLAKRQGFKTDRKVDEKISTNRPRRQFCPTFGGSQ